MNTHLELLRKQSNYPTLRFLNLMVFKISFFIGCLYVICPPLIYMQAQTEKERLLSKFSDSDRKAFEKLQGNNANDFGDLKVFSVLIYFISILVYFVFIYCFFEVSSMFVDMADNFLHFGSSS